MSSWSEGYVANVTYTYGYYQGLNPQYLTIPFLMAGIAPPKVINACELGFGQGMSLNIHATTTNTNWYGTDFNPTHANFAQHISVESGNNAQIFDQGFKEFCMREDLPDFDFIGLHGVFSWISEENRQIIVDFIRRKLKIGGVVYISYNTLPGWLNSHPMRHLMVQHKQQCASSSQNNDEIVENAFNFTQSILNASHNNQVNFAPALNSIDNFLKKHEKSYIAHEYFNTYWEPMYFSEIEALLESAKLTYACSSNPLDDYYPAMLNEQQQALMQNISSPSLRETVKDMFINNKFRTDLWVKGPRKLNSQQIQDEWKKLNILFTTNINDFSYQLTHHTVTNLIEAILNPILDLIKDNKFHNVGKLYEQLEGTDAQAHLFGVLSILYGRRELYVAQDEETIAAVAEKCQKLNNYLLNAAQTEGYAYLVSPICATAIGFNRIEQLFLLAHNKGRPQKEWANFVWEILQTQNQVLQRSDGSLINDPKENLAELQKQVKSFTQRGFQLAKILKVVK